MVQKSSNVCNRLKFGNYAYCVQKCKKKQMNIEKLIKVALSLLVLFFPYLFNS